MVTLTWPFFQWLSVCTTDTCTCINWTTLDFIYKVKFNWMNLLGPSITFRTHVTALNTNIILTLPIIPSLYNTWQHYWLCGWKTYWPTDVLVPTNYGRMFSNAGSQSETFCLTQRQYLRMFALPVSEIGQIFGTPLGFTLQPHVKI